MNPETHGDILHLLAQPRPPGVLQQAGTGGTATLLYDSLRPTMTAGSYTLSAVPSLTVGGAERLGKHAERSWSFAVRAPRYALPPGTVAACFPPPNASGGFVSTLPHVTLNRATLPWERTAGAGMPWLTLIAFDPADTAPGSAVAVSVGRPDEPLRTSTSQPGRTVRETLGHREEGQDGATVARLLSMPSALARQLLPERAASLRLGCHVRVSGADPDDPTKAGLARAVVVAARPIASKGRKAVHLVSVEGLYDEAGNLALHDPDVTTLVSLHSGEVTATSQGDAGFLAAVGRLTACRFGLDRPELDAFPPEKAMASAGAGLFRHELRNAGRTVSWYHGPLRGRSDTWGAPELGRPARTSDELLLLDASSGMIDVSYAAAWELGRLLMLSRPRLARGIASWKREHQRCMHACACCDATPEAPPMLERPEMPPFPQEAYFEQDLGALREIPFGYLVPDPAMLPAESVRFFSVDAAWMRCLKDGAFSVGRATESDYLADCRHCAANDCLTACGEMSGVLVRSLLVADWPDLVVDGFDRSQRPLTVRRAERIGPNVFLALFDGAVGTVTIHLHPMGLHLEVPQGWNGELADLPDAAGTESSAAFAKALIPATPARTFSLEAP